MYTGGYDEEAISTIVPIVWFEKRREEGNRYRRRRGSFNIFNIYKASASAYQPNIGGRIRISGASKLDKNFSQLSVEGYTIGLNLS